MIQGKGGSPENQFPFFPEVWEGHGLGTILSQYRKAYGLEIHQISERLKIRSVYLTYLEQGDYDNLPGFVYGLGFVKTYAQFLGLPVDDMAARYRLESMGEQETKPDLAAGALIKSKRETPIKLLFALFCSLLVLAYLIWFITGQVGNQNQESDGSLSISFGQQIRTFLFGSSEPAPPVDQAGTFEGEQELESRISVALNGDLSLSSGGAQGQGDTLPSIVPTIGENPEPATQQSFISATGQRLPTPKPRTVPNAIDRLRIAVPENNNQQTESLGTQDPLFQPQTVEVGAPSFGTGVTFNNLGEVAAPQTNTDNQPNQGLQGGPASDQPATNLEANEEGTADQIFLIAKSWVWVQVKDADGRPIKEASLATNETFEMPNQPNLTLVTGSLDKLLIQVNGQFVPTPASIATPPDPDAILIDAQALLNQ